MDIRLENLSKTYGTVPALSPLSLTIEKGERVCLVGPSGCGKTTLVRLLLGLIEPTTGTVTGLPEKVSAVFQENRLCPDFSLLTNVLLGDRKATKEAALELLLRLGLQEAARQKAATLSGGMARRAALARCLVREAGLYLLDEPFSGLDEATKLAAMDTLRTYTKGKTVLLVTHDKREAAYLSCRTVTLTKPVWEKNL